MNNQFSINEENFQITNAYFYEGILLLANGVLDFVNDNLDSLNYISFSFEDRTINQIEGEFNYEIDDLKFDKNRDFYMVEIFINNGLQLRFIDEFEKGFIRTKVDTNSLKTEFLIVKNNVEVKGHFSGDYKLIERITRFTN